MALDPGLARVGVAVSDPTATIARPLVTLPRRPHRKFLEAVGKLVSEHRPEKLVVGLPLRLDGRKGPEAQRAMALAFELEKHLNLPAVTADERHSTFEAADIMRENKGKNHGAPQNDRENKIDSVSAALILTRFLNAGSSNESR
jgi:putative Holliday junction resolvase